MVTSVEKAAQEDFFWSSNDDVGRKPVVLVVDDSPTAQQRIRNLLSDSQNDYEITAVTTAQEATKALQRRFDVCLLDYELSDCTGLDILAGLDPQQLSGPVLLVTAREEYGVSQAALQFGVSDFVSKSKLDADYLDRSIRYALTRFRKEKALTEFAKVDQLTGLCSRKHFEHQLEDLVAEASTSHADLSVLYLDLDGLKEINDCYGHAVGNQTLKSCANVIAMQLQTGQVLARYGGDEFVIALPNVNTDYALSLAEKMATALRLASSQDPYVTTASIGVVSMKDDVKDFFELIHHAEMAVGFGKTRYKDQVRLYQEDDVTQKVDNMRMARDLRLAIGRNELTLAYQPIFDTSGQRIVGVEALARWNHPEHGAVSPEKFVGLAETHGLIREFGQWVLMTAVRDYRDWGEKSLLPEDFTLSVNVSALQFLDNRFVGEVHKLLKGVEHLAGHLELELTENAFVRDFDRLTSMVGQLSRSGVSTALDDFGKRYSSLGYLPDFDFDTLKIDKSFVDKVGHSHRNRIVVETMVELAKKLNAKIVAEGVETTEQLRVLQQMNCDRLQGYLFSKPVDKERVEELLIARR